MPASTRLRQIPRQRSRPAIFAVIVAGLAAIYLLPFLVPVHDGLSDSWLFGFSNRTAIVLITVFVLGFAIWARGLGLRLPDRAAPANTGFRATAWIAIAASGVGCLCFWALGRMMVPLMESQYFLDRYEMFRQGGRLFQDFEFDYGPLLFYPAVWIAKLTHLSLGNAYFLSWTLQCVLGTWVLWKVVDVTARGTAHARTIFLLLWLFFLTALPDSGSNYTPLRYCGTLGVALAVHALYARGAAGIKVFGLAGLGGTVLLLYSPEQGIAFMLATIFFFALCVRRTWADLFPAFALFVFGMAAVLVLSLRMGLLSNTLIVGNGGGLNFPLLISFQSVVVLLLLLVAGCVFISGFISGAPDGPLSYLICVSAILAPAAFSRADSGHMVLNLLGALIAALVVLSQYRTLWRWTWLSFALFLLLFTFGKFNLYAGTVKFQLHDSVFGSQYPSPALTRAYVAVYKLTHKNAEARLQTLRAQSMDPQQDAATPLPAGARLLAPLGAQRRLTPLPNGIEIVSGYYPWMFPMATTDAVPRKIAELNAHPGWPLILPSRDRQVCVFDADLERASLRRFLLALYVPRPRGQLTAAKPFCDFLNQHYAPSAYASPLPRSYIWVRRDGNAGN